MRTDDNMRFYVAAYPWDLMDESIDDALDRVRGELGITGLAVHAGCPAALQLRVHKVEPRIARSRGGLFFRPSPERYQATRCKPIMSSRIGKSDPLGSWARACEARGLELRVMISAAATGRMAERYPDAACKNVYGDASRVAVCLSNPDVQAYLVDLVADLTARPGIGSICLGDLIVGWLEAYATGLEAPLALSEGDRMLLSTCFCESCQQRAMEHGVDPVVARRAVQLALDERLERTPARIERSNRPVTAKSSSDVQATASLRETVPPDCEPLSPEAGFAALCDRNKPFGRYVEQRALMLGGLLNRLAEACGVELLVRTSGSGLARDQHRAFYSEIVSARSTRLAESAMVSSVRQAHPAGLHEMNLAASKQNDQAIPDGTREIAVWSALEDEDDAPRLVSLVTHAAEHGVRGVMFEHFGLWNGAALTAIKQAVRFARRTAGV